MIKHKLPSINAPLMTEAPTLIFSPETSFQAYHPADAAQTSEKEVLSQLGYPVVIDSIVLIKNSTTRNISRETTGLST